VLLYQPPLSALARQRLETLRETSDGFRIAEKDLQLRGPGELLGTRQTGLAAFRVADLARDADLLPQVRAIAERLLADSPALADRVIARWVGAAARYASACTSAWRCATRASFDRLRTSGCRWFRTNW
jgi:ATP-dependent DNA helicase RecG